MLGLRMLCSMPRSWVIVFPTIRDPSEPPLGLGDLQLRWLRRTTSHVTAVDFNAFCQSLVAEAEAPPGRGPVKVPWVELWWWQLLLALSCGRCATRTSS